MANILILTLVFPPDSVSTAQIMGDLAADMQARGHAVTVLTTSPHYNRDPEAESRQPLTPYWGSLLRHSRYQGITVYHTFMPKKGKNIVLRLSGWVGFHLLSTLAGLTVIPRPDVIIVPSPPLTIGLSAWILGTLHRAPFVYNVQEIYPDIAIRLGALRNRQLIRLLFSLERFVYKKASKVTVIAPRMRERLLEKGVPGDKVSVVPNFVDVSDLQPMPKDNPFSRQHHVHNKFVISYAGNLGPAQGLETFVDAARLLQDEPGIHFMIMGDGILRETLRQRVVDLALNNLTFLPHQPYSLVPLIYASSDLNLVPQAAEIGFDAVPSKVYRIMACARPVLAITVTSSDLGQLVLGAQCGMVVPPGMPDALAQTIRTAYCERERWKQLGEAGRRHVIENYSRTMVTDRYLALAQEAIAR
jgi:colanic acid biosynthesis glycosyl transferase WcaI